jgi:protein-tyrosine phosphatase
MQCEKISKIVTYPNGSSLFLSGVQAYDEIDQHHIGTVLSFIEGRVPNLTSQHIRHYTFEIEDHPRANIYKLFDQTYAIIMSAIQQNQNILVHCRAGVSRSATIVVAFFLKCLRCNPELVVPFIPKTQLTWTDSIVDYVRSKRNCIRPNDGFIQQLRAYERIILLVQTCNPPTIPFGNLLN